MKKYVKIITIMVMTTVAMPLVAQNSNPLLQEWKTPYQTPPFSQIKNEHYAPAVKEAIKEAEKNIEKIIDQKEAPTFENTIEALQLASRKLDRIPNSVKSGSNSM